MHLADLLWTTVVIFFMVIYFMMLFRVVIDVFRSDDLGGWGKAAWFLALLVFPLISLLVYVITRGSSMAKRDVQQVEAMRQAQEKYIADAAAKSSGGPADEIARAHDLLTSGAITQVEFDTLKTKALSG